MFKVAGIILTTQGDVSSCKEMANAEWEVTRNKITGVASGIITQISTLSSLPSTLKELLEDYNGLYFLPPLHDKLLSQIAGPSSSVPKELRMSRKVYLR